MTFHNECPRLFSIDFTCIKKPQKGVNTKVKWVLWLETHVGFEDLTTLLSAHFSHYFLLQIYFLIEKLSSTKEWSSWKRNENIEAIVFICCLSEKDFYNCCVTVVAPG